MTSLPISKNQSGKKSMLWIASKHGVMPIARSHDKGRLTVSNGIDGLYKQKRTLSSMHMLLQK
jgi:hypothetical protein